MLDIRCAVNQIRNVTKSQRSTGKIKISNDDIDYAKIGDLIKTMQNAATDKTKDACLTMIAAAVLAGLLINHNSTNKNDNIKRTIEILPWAAQQDFDEVLEGFNLQMRRPELIQWTASGIKPAQPRRQRVRNKVGFGFTALYRVPP
jgi:hypothetical protein